MRILNACSISILAWREWPKRSSQSKSTVVEKTAYRYKTIIGRGV
jgi:hypothetical protein